MTQPQTSDATGGEACEAFFSYARVDRERVLPVVAALRAAGLGVFLDEVGIDEFEGITPVVRGALAQARLFLAFYSSTYPTRSACQWELLTAFRAATALGQPSRRILVVNPEEGPGHIEPVELRDARYAFDGGTAGLGRLVERVQEKVADSPGPLGDAIASARPVWRPTEHVGSERFVGRVAEFWRLHSCLHAFEYPATQDEASAGQAVITGLGGVGKTLLAEQYARRFSSFYPGGIYWFTASNRAAPDTTATETLAGEVCTGHHQQMARIFDIDPAQANLEQIREAARRRIQDTGRPCLWVVDDVPGRLPLDVVRELAAPHPLGRTVFTTRWRGYPLPTVEVDVLPRQEAYQLLTSARTPDEAGEASAADELVDQLGCHALAIDLARGCLADQPGLTYRDLCAELADTQHGDAFQALVDDIEDQVPTGHTRDIAATFTRSLTTLDPDTLTLLHAAALLARAPIPEPLLQTVITQTSDADEQTARRTLRRTLSAAQRRSLLRPAGTRPPTWFLHALLARTLRLEPTAQDSLPNLRAAVLTAATHLMQPVYDPGRLDQLANLTPHARALTENLDLPQTLPLLDALARYELKTGHPVTAAHHYQCLTEARTRDRGANHPDTFTTRNNLASAFHDAGQPQRAIELFERLLADRERVLGSDHPDTLTTRNNLASAFQYAGQPQRAIELFERLLPDRERVLGSDHPDTLTTRNNLASAFHDAGQPQRAIELFERLLADRERVLGSDHPGTLTTRNNLASAFHDAGQPQRAIELFERLLPDLERVLGSDHPYTLDTRNNLASAFREAGQPQRAIELFERLLPDLERALGPDHPYTLTARNNLANAYWMAGQPQRAIELFERLLPDLERALSPDHPYTLTTRNNLAEVRQHLDE